MHARVTHFRILPGKLEEFSAAVKSLIPLLHKQQGFRGIFVVHTQTTDPIEVETISMWDSLEDLAATEQNLYFYQALSRVQAFAQGFPSIHVHRVLVSEIPTADRAPH